MRSFSLVAIPALICIAASCESTPKNGPPVAGIPPKDGITWADRTISPNERWSRKMPGLVTDLSVASKTREILIGIIPDTDRASSPITEPQLLLVNSAGTTLWQKNLSSKVKSLDIASDGTFLAVTTYDEKLTVYNGAGSKLWQSEAFCRPHAIASTKQVICDYDDDANTHIAFDVFGSDGKKVYTQKISRDLLEIAVSEDEKWVAISLAGGEVQLLTVGADGVWKFLQTIKRPGEIVDVSVSSGTSPTLAILFNEQGRGKKMRILKQRLVLLKPLEKHAPAFNEAVDYFAEKAVVSPTGETVVLYGNSVQGQKLVAWHLEGQGKSAWVVHENRHADFSSIIQIGHDSVIAGFENIPVGGIYKSALFGFGMDGRARWTIPLTTEEGAYLYSNRYSGDQDFLVIATDEGHLQAFEIR